MTLEQESQINRGVVALMMLGFARAETGPSSVLAWIGFGIWALAFVLASLRLLAPHVGPLPHHDPLETTRIETRSQCSVGEPYRGEDGRTVLAMRWRLSAIARVWWSVIRDREVPMRKWPAFFVRGFWSRIGQRSEMVISAKSKAAK